MANFWTDATIRDPKRAYRFTVDMSPGNGVSTSWFIKKVTKPSVSVSESAHTYLNHTFYYPGRVSWNSINMTLVDPVNPDAAAIFMQYLQDVGYQPPSLPTHVQTISKRKATGGEDGLGTVSINQIDGDGFVIEQWDLHNAWIKSVALGDLDYESDQLSNITLEIRYDWAALVVHGPMTDTTVEPGSPVDSTTPIFSQGGTVGPITTTGA